MPTVALVQGGCFGGGTGIVPACDVVIAADNALFSISEVRWGLTAAIIIPQLSDAISVRQVRRYALTGERFGAAEAQRIGLVHLVVPAERLAAAGEEMVGRLLENGPTAMAETKATTLQSAWGGIDRETFDALVEAHARKRQTAEAAEGLASFAEKRAARWSGQQMTLIEDIVPFAAKPIHCRLMPASATVFAHIATLARSMSRNASGCDAKACAPCSARNPCISC